jgi:hypothetical protein
MTFPNIHAVGDFGLATFNRDMIEPSDSVQPGYLGGDLTLGKSFFVPVLHHLTIFKKWEQRYTWRRKCDRKKIDLVHRTRRIQQRQTCTVLE